MSLEEYEVRLEKKCIVVIDLADASDRATRYEAIVGALRKAGASPITRHSFAFSNERRDCVQTLKVKLQDFVKAGDQVFVIADADRGMTGTALVPPNYTEGITVCNEIGIDD